MSPNESVFNYVRIKFHEESLNKNISFERTLKNILLVLNNLYYHYQLNICFERTLKNILLVLKNLSYHY